GVIVTEDAFMYSIASREEDDKMIRFDGLIPIPVLKDVKLLDILVEGHVITLLFTETITLQWNGHTWTDHNSIISEYTDLKSLLPIITNPLLNKFDGDDGSGDSG